MKELLKKRFKVIADFPLSAVAVGEVLAPYDGSTNLCVVEGGFFVTDLSKYPHIFKELHWSDERELDELPDYVKHKSTGEVYKFYGFRNGFLDVTGTEYNYGLPKENALPATEQEYLNYKKELA